MPSRFDRVLAALGLQQRSFNPFTPAEWQALQSGMYGFQTSMTNKQPELGGDYMALVGGAYGGNPIVFACINARAQLFSEARFQFQELKKGRPGNLYSNPSLGILEQPWPGGSTMKLLKDMLIDADLAGNAFVVRRGSTLQRLRPDWVTIIAGSPTKDANTWDPDVEVLGYGYQPGGPGYGAEKIYFQRPEVAHFKSTHDPARRFSGMSWLVPIIREITSDNAATGYKQMYWENAATPNLVVKFEPTKTMAAAKEWIDLFNKDHTGVHNAYKTLFLGGGSDAQVVGSSLRQADFKSTQGAGETRIASAAGVPPIVIGLSEGLAAATYSNYGQARRAFADGTMRPLWHAACDALGTIVPAPSGSRLWYDERDIPFLQEDVMDAAEIQSRNAMTIESLIRSGYKPESARDAVISGDFAALTHTGLFSVQLRPPEEMGQTTGTTAAPAADVSPTLPEGPKPALLNSGPVAGEVRCQGCNRLLAEMAAEPYRLRCTRCKTLNESGTLIAA